MNPLTDKGKVTNLKSHPFARHLVCPLEIRLPSGVSAWIPRCSYRFKPWRGKPLANTYGGKAVLCVCGKPLFAELAILRILQDEGWDGVWVDTYRKKFRQHLAPHECSLPAHAQRLYDEIRRTNHGTISGCFDVFAWKANKYLFVESKRHRKDAIQKTQKQWIQAALKSGLALKSLLICEWNL